MSDWDDYYLILGIDRNATQQEIEEAYKFRAFTLHPDRLKDAPKSKMKRAEEELKKLNVAAEVLRDPNKRKQYNSEWDRKRQNKRVDAEEPSYGESDPRVAELIRRLMNGDFETRKFAASQLAEFIDDTQALNALIRALEMDKSSEVRMTAAISLGKFSDPKIIDPIIRALTMDGNMSVRLSALEILVKILKEPKIIDILILALKDPAEYIKLRALEVLGRINEDKAIDTLILALKDPITEIRKSAAVSLGNLKNPKAIDPMVQALISNDELSIPILDALGKFDGSQVCKSIIDAIIEHGYDNDHGYHILSKSFKLIAKCNTSRANDIKFKVLNGVLTRSVEGAEYNFSGVLFAIDTLGKLGDHRAVCPLVQLLGKIPDSDHTHFHVEAVIAEALGRLNDKSAIGPLIRLFKKYNEDCDKYNQVPWYAYEPRSNAEKALSMMGVDARSSLPHWTDLFARFK